MSSETAPVEGQDPDGLLQSTKESYFSKGENVTMFSDGLTDFERKKHPSHVPTGSTQVLTFYPTLEEFKDFSGYISKIEAVGAHSRCGICKVVPPDGWTPRPSKSNFDDVDDYVIHSPVKEIIEYQSGGVYRKTNEIYKKNMTVKEFRQLAKGVHYRPPTEFQGMEGRDMENYFFGHILERTPIYGADTEGSIYDASTEEFNMNHLGTVLDDYKKIATVRGVNTVYLYFGMYKTCFPWHAEDMDLYSINYLHFGAPKYWFAIPAEGADRFEKLLDQLYPDWRSQCRSFPRHKLCMVSPDVLRAHDIPFGTMIQRPNEFIITFPRGYHMGFNTGYNCAESTNFATDRWIDYGKNVVVCQCKDSVMLNMESFMKQYRAQEEEIWKKYWFGLKATYIETYPYPKETDKKRRGSNAEKALGDRLKRKRGNWLRNQTSLWSRGPPDLFAEKEENKTVALYPPHCAVCSLFYPRSHAMNCKEEQIPHRSQRLVTSLFFSKSSTAPEVDDPVEDDLVTCENCYVTVHPSCYGGPVADRLNWRCLRCRGRSDVAIRHTSCNLCERRAGALIPCETGIDHGFAHVVCAMMNRLTWFDQSIGPTKCKTYPAPNHMPRSSLYGFLNMAYTEATDKHMENSRWNCEICQTVKEGLIACSLCIETLDQHEWTLAHTTCGKQAGFLFEERKFPQVMAMVCDKHIFNRYGEDLPMIPQGANVSVKTSKKKTPGRVQMVYKAERLAVTKLNKDYDDTVDYQSVVSCSCSECDGFYHMDGARLRISRQDGSEEDCYYRTAYTYTEYTVLLGNGKEKIVTRPEIGLPKDKLNMAVKRRIDDLQ